MIASTPILPSLNCCDFGYINFPPLGGYNCDLPKFLVLLVLLFCFIYHL